MFKGAAAEKEEHEMPPTICRTRKKTLAGGPRAGREGNLGGDENQCCSRRSGEESLRAAWCVCAAKCALPNAREPRVGGGGGVLLGY